MKGFKRCSSGHFYKETLVSCPHCSTGQNSGDSNLDRTAVNPGKTGDFDKTQVFGQQGMSNNAATQMSSNGDATQVFGAGNGGAAPMRDLDKTYIGGVTDELNNLNGKNADTKIDGSYLSFIFFE